MKINKLPSSALLAMIIITVPLAYFILTRKNPYRFLYGLMPATIHGFATSSRFIFSNRLQKIKYYFSVASIPITTECLVKQNLDPRIVKFFLPLSIILNTVQCFSHEIKTLSTKTPFQKLNIFRSVALHIKA